MFALRCRCVLAAALIAVPALAACSGTPTARPSGSVSLTQLQAEPPAASATAVADVVTAAISESDPARPIYASWPDIAAAPALTKRLAAVTAADVADFKRDDPVYPNVSVAPEFAGSWDFAGVGKQVLGVRLTQYRFAGTSGATSTKTFWTDLQSGVVVTSSQLLAGNSAGSKVVNEVVSKAEASGINPNAAGMSADELLTSITFDRSGDLVVTLDQGAITSYSRGVLSIPVKADNSLLSPVGQTVRAALMDNPSTPSGSSSSLATASAPVASTGPSMASAAPATSAVTSSAPATAAVSSSASTVDCAKVNCVALTFDDGPGPLTDQVLSALQAAHAQASFFVLGANAAASPDVVTSLCQAGMQIGTEGWDHRDFTGLDSDEILSEMQQSVATISSACAGQPTVMRPPYGNYDDAMRSQVGMPIITWSLDSQDWEASTADSVLDQVLDNVVPGSIVDLHDNEQVTLDALPAILAGLTGRGFSLVTVSELLGPNLTAGQVYDHR